MGWPDRLHTALTAEAAAPDAAECADAKTAKTAKTSAEGVLARLAVLAEGCFPQSGPAVAVVLPSAVSGLASACEARAEALAGAFDRPDVQADRAAIAAEELSAVPPPVSAPPADMVEALAEAVAWQPGQRITDPVKAME